MGAVVRVTQRALDRDDEISQRGERGGANRRGGEGRSAARRPARVVRRCGALPGSRERDDRPEAPRPLKQRLRREIFQRAIGKLRQRRREEARIVRVSQPDGELEEPRVVARRDRDPAQVKAPAPRRRLQRSRVSDGGDGGGVRGDGGGSIRLGLETVRADDFPVRGGEPRVLAEHVLERRVESDERGVVVVDFAGGGLSVLLLLLHRCLLLFIRGILLFIRCLLLFIRGILLFIRGGVLLLLRGGVLL